MTTVVYVGPFDEIEHQQTTEAWSSDSVGWTVTKHGAEVEVSDEIAALLLEQPDNWQPAKPAKTKTNTKGDA